MIRTLTARPRRGAVERLRCPRFDERQTTREAQVGERRNRVRGAWPLLALLAAGGVQAQSASCLEFKERVTARIEASGVRDFVVEFVPAANGVPAGAKAVGTCDGGSLTVVYRRGVAAATAAAPRVAASAPSAGAVTDPARPRVPSALPVAPTASSAAPTPTLTPTPNATPTPTPKPTPTPTPTPSPTPKPTASAPAAPTPAPTPLATDNSLQRLSQLPFELESPESLDVGDSARVRLAAGASAPALADSRLVVQLSSPSLEVTEVPPAADAASGAVRTEWLWQVRATEPGAQALQLTLNAETMVNGAVERRTVRTFHRTVRVQPAGDGPTWRLLRDHWPWVLAALLLPAAAFGWSWHARRSAYDEQGLPRGPKIRI